MSNIEKSVLKLDPKSERYRICPEDNVAFMTHHLSRKFCPGTNCKTAYNNRLKRQGKLTSQIKKKQIELKASADEIKKNIKILDRLNIQSQGSPFEFERLKKLGFDYTKYSGTEYTNIDTQEKRFRFGPYSLLHTKNNTVLINKR